MKICFFYVKYVHNVDTMCLIICAAHFYKSYCDNRTRNVPETSAST